MVERLMLVSSNRRGIFSCRKNESVYLEAYQETSVFPVLFLYPTRITTYNYMQHFSFYELSSQLECKPLVAATLSICVFFSSI